MNNNHNNNHISQLTLGGLIVTLGIVYGNIGTSPLYVMKAILAGIPIIKPEFIIGAVSCIIWTLTLQTTLKYIVLTIRADNKGEGGILSLYALLRKQKGKIFIFAIIGASTLIVDGFITPSITVISAIEGLKMLKPDIPVLPIVVVIITLLFISQQFGTNVLGKSFGPFVAFWFAMLGVLGLIHLIDYPQIFAALNPWYAFKFLANHPHGFVLLGAVFLCTTGSEAIYSDLGHCGLKNIRISWVYVKICLILNYLGQGAWIISNKAIITADTNPFFTIMPQWFVFSGIIIATIAAIIASQALISGSYTLISEAILLNLWAKVEINYPTNIKGQMYIPSINWLLYLACIFVVLYFQKSSNMEAAYGLSITITMLMTTALLTYYLRTRIHLSLLILFISTYVIIEGAFLISNLHKFVNGGWFTLTMATVIGLVMYIWYRGREIKKKYTQFVQIKDFAPVITDLKNDKAIPKYATNLIYLTRADKVADVESKIIYSIINKQPKRADVYWFIHVHVLDEPRTMEYAVETLIPDTLFRIEFRIGFKVNPRINLFLRQVIDDMVNNKEVVILSRYSSLQKHNISGDFRFIMIERILTYDFEFSTINQFIMSFYYRLKHLGISDVKAFGLDTSNVIVEKVPLIVKPKNTIRLSRVKA